MCKRHVEQTIFILRCRTYSSLGRKSGYLKRWLEYSNEFEALNKLGKNMLDYINSKLWRKKCCGRCSCWTLSSGTEKMIEPKTPWTPQTMPVYCFKESFISWTNWIKAKLKSMQSKELFACSSRLSTLQRGTHYSEKQNIHVPGIEKGMLILD